MLVKGAQRDELQWHAGFAPPMAILYHMRLGPGDTQTVQFLWQLWNLPKVFLSYTIPRHTKDLSYVFS